MELYMFLGFMGTLRETQKLFCKNGKLMVSITLLTLLLNSLLYLFNILMIKPLMKNFLNEENLILTSTPGNPEFANILINLQKDLGIFAGMEWTYLLINSIISLFLSTITIFASAITHEGKDFITIQTLLLGSMRLWKRPLITWFYTTLLGLGYIFIFVISIFPFSLILQSNTTITFHVFLIVVSIPASLLYVQISIIWTLALVISILEDINGIEALGKAAKIVKGMKIHGFLLNLVFTIIISVLVQGIRLIGIQKPMAANLIIGFLVICIICLVKMVWVMAYTLFYYQCKKIHGEEVELQAGVEYTKVPTNAPLIGENIA